MDSDVQKVGAGNSLRMLEILGPDEGGTNGKVNF